MSNIETSHPKINVGLSACLAGFKVRFDGQHKRSSLCLNELSDHFEFKTFCPEMAAGFGTPRPTMRLVGDPKNPTLTYTPDNKREQIDLSDRLIGGFKDEIPGFADLKGFILMKNSPSCGLERVKVYQENGHPHMEPGRGLFADALVKAYPLMPIEEEGRLHDARLYENFVLRVYAYHNFHEEVLKQPSIKALIDFHSSYKYVLMAHSPVHYKSLGRLVAQQNEMDFSELLTQYFKDLMEALAKPATRKNHTNTLQHIIGYVRENTSAEARKNITDTIFRYKDGEIPLVVPLTLLKHYVDQHGSTYIQTQRYLQPYPEKLGLTNKL